MLEKKTKTAGRPPKCMIRKIEDRQGILKAPFNKDNIFELTHNNPNMFKHIFEGSKKVSDVVKFIFSPEGVKMLFVNSSNLCTELVEIDGTRLVGYYCDRTYYYTCVTTTLNIVVGLKKCNFEYIRLFINKNNQFIMYLCFLQGYKSDGTADIEESWDVQLERCAAVDVAPLLAKYEVALTYPLIFTYKWSMLKDSVNSWKKLVAKNIIFSKDHDTPFTASFQEDEIKHVTRINRENIIDLQFKSDFIVAVQIDLKSLLCMAPSNDISDYITMYLSPDMNQDTIMFAKVDEAYENKKDAVPNTATTTVKYFIPKS